MNQSKRAMVVFLGMVLCATGTRADNVSEAQPDNNDTKATATLATLASGDSISGTINSTLSTKPDYFKVTTVEQPASDSPVIYRHELSFGAALGVSYVLSGLRQSSGQVSATDFSFQTASSLSTPANTLVWYGFGQAESVYVKVSGTSLNVTYTGTLADTAVSPVVASGALYPGPFVFQTTGLRSDIWLYKQDPATKRLTVVASAGANKLLGGVPNMVDGQTVQAGFASPTALTPGTYIMAIGSWNDTANDQPSPSSDAFDKAVLDFPDAIANNTVYQSTLYGSLHFVATDAGGNSATADVDFPQNNNAVVRFVQFTVLAPPLPTLSASWTTPSPAMTGQGVTIEAQLAPPPQGSLDDITSVTADVSALTGNAGDTAVVLSREGATDVWSCHVVVDAGLSTGTVAVPMSIDDPSVPGVAMATIMVDVMDPPPAGICCRGAKCDVTVTDAGTCDGLPNARFSTLGSSCNTGGNTHVPCCVGDYNKDNTVNVADIFAFLRGWFGADQFADATQDNAVNVSDIFAFLRAWFGGSCSTS